MIKRMPFALAVSALMLTAPFFAGCNGEAGPIWFAKRYPESTAQFRTELELIPNAELVRIDTMPQWELGRHAYRRGADRLLVLTRITGWAPPLEKDWTNENYIEPKGPRPITDREWERAWITIPYGTTVGQRVVIEDLEARFLTGYDRRQSEADAYYILPHKMLGTLTLVEEKPDELVFDLNLEVRPLQTKNWYIKKQMTVPITLTGKHAKVAEESDQLIIAGIRRRPEDVEQPLIGLQAVAAQPGTAIAPAATDASTKPPTFTTRGSDSTDPVAPAVDKTTKPATTTQDKPDTPGNATTDAAKPEEGDAPEGDEKPVTEIAGKSMLGQWYVNTEMDEFQLQFDEDGTFAMAHTHDESSPRMYYGTYKVKSGYIILRTLRSKVDGRDNTDSLGTKFSLMRASWMGDKLVLDGNFRGYKVHLRTYHKELVDLRSAAPVGGRKQGADTPDEGSSVSIIVAPPTK